LVEPFFTRAKLPEVIAKVEAMTIELIDAALAAGEIEAVGELALRLPSQALTYLLGVEEEGAETWIRWGIHVFHDGGVNLDEYRTGKTGRARRCARHPEI
jgi:cytochrome P450